MEENKKNSYNSFSLIRFLWKWRYPLLIVCIAAAVLSFFFSTSLFIKPKFKATTIIYAPRTNSLSKILTNEHSYNERLEIKAYGIEEETEQMMQILNSRDIQDALIKKFNLIEYYKIDTNAKYWETKLYKSLIGNLKIKRTEFGAISITVTDHDPVVAANMANEVSRQLDTVKNKIERERATAAYFILKKQLEDVTDEIKRVDDSLKIIMEHGVFDFETQSERVTQQYAIAVSQGNTAGMQRLQQELNKLATWGPQSEALRELQYNFREYQALCKSKMMDAKVDMESRMPVKFVIEKAIPADKKSYPKKSIIMITSTIATLIVAIIILLIMENIRNSPEFNPRRREKKSIS